VIDALQKNSTLSLGRSARERSERRPTESHRPPKTIGSAAGTESIRTLATVVGCTLRCLAPSGNRHRRTPSSRPTFKAGLAIHGREIVDGDLVFHVHLADDGNRTGMPRCVLY